MLWNEHIQTITCLFLTIPGIVGNMLIFGKYVYDVLMVTEKKPIDLVLVHLVFSNMLIICSIVVSEAAIKLYFKIFLGDAGCKVVVFLGRMARGLSICTTCLLSMVQAVTINPRMTLWRKLKPQTAGQVLPYLLLFWVINSLISSNLLYYITALGKMNRSDVHMYSGYCIMLPPSLIVRWTFLSLMAVRDIVFQSLMGWSSASMALHLYKHHKRVLYLHSSRRVNNSSPEIRATQSTLILMTCFLVFYWVDFLFSCYTGSTLTQDSIISIIKSFLNFGFAVLSPFVLIARDVARYQRAHYIQKLHSTPIHSFF